MRYSDISVLPPDKLSSTSVLTKGSAFARNPKANELLHFMDDTLHKLAIQHKVTVLPPNEKNLRDMWKSAKGIGELLGVEIANPTYISIVKRLNQLAHFMHVKDVNEFLMHFTRAQFITNDKLKQDVQIFKGENGKWFAVAKGGRKSCKAEVTIVENGTGEVLINGIDAREVVQDFKYWYDIAKPFIVTGTINKYNVSAQIEGGGLRGKSGAITNGISKALAILRPEFQTILYQSGLLIRDPRMKERKKPGQPGARKKFKWVKR
ncbi:Ribosomal protein S5 2-type fold, subgroup domain-containing protein [Rozella allomycis CSF55]|uniref:Ribosomal protein S5 2-type fold, subgroup domain-containing protein n=1 Tax=Rozella allomycis (strain CSF55) TaxID=988480 RepID=A0A075AYI4_ROZAC|nr:Ribosomal protein S5 2-type fold, subgroup domain-containing protein [Rozella allomycis CSF55]|eukprot:EPZ33782.1 Ribosomal protein S5 2-type fold, subgroup domain-containing protein [Rozella allomycis CSF55]